MVDSGIVDLSADGAVDDINRSINYRNFLIKMRGVDSIIYEKVMSHSMTVYDKKTKKPKKIFGVIAAHLYGWFEIELKIFCNAHHIPLIGLHHSSIKKEFVGSGKATKADVCRRCHELGWTGGRPGTDKDHDEADARAMLHVELAKYHERVIVEK